MAITWPFNELRLGVNESAPKSASQFDPIAGAPLIFLRTNTRVRRYSGNFLLETEADLDVFLDWYFDTLKYGTLRFRMARPGRVGSEVYEWQFDHGAEPYTISGSPAAGYVVQVSLVLIRRIS